MVLKPCLCSWLLLVILQTTTHSGPGRTHTPNDTATHRSISHRSDFTSLFSVKSYKVVYNRSYFYSSQFEKQPQKDSKPRSSAKWTPGPDQPWNWWNFGNDNIANDQVPMSCSGKLLITRRSFCMFSMLFTIICLYPCWTDKDSKDLAYVRKVIEFIDSNPTMFNNQKIYIQGDFCIFYEYTLMVWKSKECYGESGVTSEVLCVGLVYGWCR